jgi:hypothetical protein
MDISMGNYTSSSTATIFKSSSMPLEWNMIEKRQQHLQQMQPCQTIAHTQIAMQYYLTNM